MGSLFASFVVAVADSIRFATIFGVARTEGPLEWPGWRDRGASAIGRSRSTRRCEVILIGHSVTCQAIFYQCVTNYVWN